MATTLIGNVHATAAAARSPGFLRPEPEKSRSLSKFERPLSPGARDASGRGRQDQKP
jgi:hypothetical protein